MSGMDYFTPLHLQQIYSEASPIVVTSAGTRQTEQSYSRPLHHCGLCNAKKAILGPPSSPFLKEDDMMAYLAASSFTNS
jgi:hypothetical protein